MNNDGAVSVGWQHNTIPKYRTFLCLLAIITTIAIPAMAYDASFTPLLNDSVVHINETYVHDSSPGTPWVLWVSSGIAAVLLFIYSLKSRASSSETEIDALVSVLSWFPAGFFTYASLNVDKLEGAGLVAIASGTSTVYTYLANHVIYHFTVIAVLGGAFTLLCIFNTFRIISLHRTLKGRESMEQWDGR